MIIFEQITNISWDPQLSMPKDLSDFRKSHTHKRSIIILVILYKLAGAYSKFYKYNRSNINHYYRVSYYYNTESSARGTVTDHLKQCITNARDGKNRRRGGRVR